MLDLISDDEHNRFTKRDVLDAMNMYQENYVTYSRAEVERVSGISVPPNKRNGRKQDKHLQGARAIRDINNENWREENGRKPKSEIVEEWRKAHPDGKKADCIRDTGLSKPTVYKWWSVGEASKAFPLNYPRAIRKRVSRAVARLCSLPLILFLYINDFGFGTGKCGM